MSYIPITTRLPINYWFVPRNVPAGSAPIEIRSQWLDVPLPVRRPITPEGPESALSFAVGPLEVGKMELVYTEDSVAVGARDAIKSLRLFERQIGARWWAGYFGMRLNAEADPPLIFSMSEGRLYPASYMQLILPGVAGFDSL